MKCKTILFTCLLAASITGYSENNVNNLEDHDRKYVGIDVTNNTEHLMYVYFDGENGSANWINFRAGDNGRLYACDGTYDRGTFNVKYWKDNTLTLYPGKKCHLQVATGDDGTAAIDGKILTWFANMHRDQAYELKFAATRQKGSTFYLRSTPGKDDDNNHDIYKLDDKFDKKKGDYINKSMSISYF